MQRTHALRCALTLPAVPWQVAALKNLGLNIKRAKLQTTESGVRHKFFITDSLTAEKVRPSKWQRSRMKVAWHGVESSVGVACPQTKGVRVNIYRSRHDLSLQAFSGSCLM